VVSAADPFGHEYFSENSAVNFGAVCSSCDDIASTVTSQSQRPTDANANGQASVSGAVWREGWTLLGAKFKLPYSDIALSLKPLAIGHVYMYTVCLE
jgi:hypothetical protein